MCIRDSHDNVPQRVWISAKQNIGMDLLNQALTERLSKTIVQQSLRIPPAFSRLRGVLYGLNCIDSESYSDNGDWLVNVRMPKADWKRLDKNLETGLSDFVIQH